MRLIVLWMLLSTTVMAGERRYALVIGANEGDAAEPPLLYAERDAVRVAEVLSDYGGVHPGDMVVLTNPDAARVRESLERIAARMGHEAAQNGTLFTFYYSGHADADELHLAGSRLPLAELKDAVEDTPADVRLVLLDACRAGAITRLKGAAPIAPFEISIDSGHAGTAIITASAFDEDAQESELLRGGIFTHHLIAGLQGAADGSGDLVVSLSEIYDYTSARTRMTTSRAPIVQHPSHRFDISGEGELALAWLSGVRRAGVLSLAEGGEYVLFSPKTSDVIFEFTVPDGGQMTVPAGDYLLRRRQPERVEQAEVTVSEGRTTVVSGGDLAPLPYGQTARRGVATAARPALGVLVGSSYGSSILQGTTSVPTAVGGVRLDRPELTAIGRARYGATGDQSMLDVDLAGFKLWDPDERVAIGAGARSGMIRLNDPQILNGGVWLWHFDVAPRIEFSPISRASIGLEGGAGAYLHRSEALGAVETGSLNAEVVFYLSADVSLFVF